MVEHFYDTERRCRSLRRGPLGPSIDGFASLLVEQGYAKSSGRCRIRLVGHFSEWLDRRGLQAGELNEQEVSDFLKARWKKLHHDNFEEPTLALLLDHLRQTAVIPQRLSPPATALDCIQQDYAQFLGCERGFTKITLRNYLRIARQFLFEQFGNGKIHLDKIHPEDVTRFILERGRVMCPSGLHTVASVLRSFLGFLCQRGGTASNLAPLVPPLANPGPAEPSPILTPYEIKQLLARSRRDSYESAPPASEIMLFCFCWLGWACVDVKSVD